jgi:hypothetical protein
MLRAKQHIARYEGDVINDNGDNIAPKSIPLGRSRKLVGIVGISAEGKETYSRPHLLKTKYT